MKLYSVVKEPLCLLSLAGDALEFLLLMHLCYFVYMHETGVWCAVKWRQCVHDNCFIFDHLLGDSFLVAVIKIVRILLGFFVRMPTCSYNELFLMAICWFIVRSLFCHNSLK
ncbi:hypothetical protein PRUPE_3G053400 [Prunus persica]|uniref:Uncharacterized protein n=1 Tax=Prunus persica TaxID=3760 RepID=A0A251PYV6_PRUPE|nr:hypothetical protein PRUPE_3G053400 [Prunus persica]